MSDNETETPTGLTEAVLAFLAKLRALWPEVEPIPLYPAFRPQPPESKPSVP